MYFLYIDFYFILFLLFLLDTVDQAYSDTACPQKSHEGSIILGSQVHVGRGVASFSKVLGMRILGGVSATNTNYCVLYVIKRFFYLNSFT